MFYTSFKIYLWCVGKFNAGHDRPVRAHATLKPAGGINVVANWVMCLQKKGPYNSSRAKLYVTCEFNEMMYLCKFM